MKNYLLKFNFLFLVVFFCFFGVVRADTGTIDTTYFKSKLDLDDSVIYWRTTNGDPVSVTDSALTGQIWGSTVGWIDLSPTGGGVVNDGNGNLSGTAWGSVAGWVNFGPFSNNGTQTVQILDDGSFDGYAWSSTFGWIIFDCDVANACLKTDWGVDTPPEDDGGGGGGGPTDPVDPIDDNPPVDEDPVDEENPPVDEPPVEDTPDEEVPPPPTDPVDDNIPTPPNPPASGDNFDGDIPEEIKKIISSEEAKIASSLLTTIGFVSGLFSLLTSVFLLDPALISSLYTIPGRLSGLLFGGLWFRKKKPWGVVYDSITKQPIDPAYVVLYDTAGKQIATSITDLEGRYGFLVEPGVYSIVANKTNYIFPSKILSGKIEDELYADLYFGGPINISDKDNVINKNIPMDAISFDWNEFAKRDRGLMKNFQNREKIIMRLSEIMFYVGFIVSLISLYLSISTYNIIVVSLYVLLSILRIFGFHMESHGGVVDQNGRIVPFALIKFFQASTGLEIAHKVTDKNGRYFCLIKNGVYYATVEEKLADGKYSEPKKTAEFTVKNGRINKLFEL